MRTAKNPNSRVKTYRVRTRYSALSQVTQRHEEKHSSPMEGQFYDLKDKHQNERAIGVRHIFSVQLYVGTVWLSSSL